MKKITEHYTQSNLLSAIEAGLKKLGKTPDSLTIDDLAPVDEFHIGGRPASTHLFEQLALNNQHKVLDKVLDIGCGLGGPARFVATSWQCHVTGIDLTPEYVSTGNALSEWLGLSTHVKLHEGNALSIPFDDNSFDAGYMMHVGMNIEDKHTLYQEISRLLKPNARFAIYDVMRTNDEALRYPVPWATDESTSFVVSPIDYKQALENAGFCIEAENNRREFALDFVQKLRVQTASAGGPPPLGLHIVMGSNASIKTKNLMDNIANGRVAPVEVIVRNI